MDKKNVLDFTGLCSYCNAAPDTVGVHQLQEYPHQVIGAACVGVCSCRSLDRASRAHTCSRCGNRGVGARQL